jgi:hypothetical protein
MSGAIPPLTQHAFMEWCLVKHRDNFTLRLPSSIEIPVAAQSKAHMVLNRLNTGITVSNPSRDMDVDRVSLSCADPTARGTENDRSNFQGVLPKCLKGLAVSKANSESEQARGPNP